MSYNIMESWRSQEGSLGLESSEKWPWRDYRKKASRLARLYQRAGFDTEAGLSASCSTWLQFGLYEGGAGSDGEEARLKLRNSNFCKLRLCPGCTARKAKRNAWRLSRVMDRAEVDAGCRYLFLTLTVKNCKGDELSRTLGELVFAWDRLRKQRKIGEALQGWFRALEITRNSDDGSYHPHIHAILAVPPAYFFRGSGLYISQRDWEARWQRALRVDYKPRVHIATTKAAKGGKAAALEASKYCTKDSEYISDLIPDDVAAGIVGDYTRALHRRRLTAYGGCLKDAAKALDLEDMDVGDLVHLGDEIREDLALLIVEYRWNVGAGDYVLERVAPPPMEGIDVSADGFEG